jgi:hypothetical protein
MPEVVRKLMAEYWLNIGMEYNWVGLRAEGLMAASS